MYLDNKDSVKLSELIYWVKKEILSDEVPEDDSVPLFVIDEVTVEINFVLTGEGEGGFDAVVVKAGSKVGEERIQKAIVRMKPLVPYEDLVKDFNERHPLVKRKVLSDSLEVLLKGRMVQTNEDAIPEVDE